MKGLGCFHEQSVAEDQKPQPQQHRKEIIQQATFVSPFIPQARSSWEEGQQMKEVHQEEVRQEEGQHKKEDQPQKEGHQADQPQKEVRQEEGQPKRRRRKEVRQKEGQHKKEVHQEMEVLHSSGDEQVQQEGRHKEGETFREECETMSFS